MLSKEDCCCFVHKHFDLLPQAMMQIIDTLSSCVRHAGSFDEPPDLVAIRSLPTCILKILRETFQHCKVSLFTSLVAVMHISCHAVVFVVMVEWFDWYSYLI